MGAKTKKSHSILVDDKDYWQQRHSKTQNLKASGVKSVGVRSNQYIYKILAEQYLTLLKTLDLKDVKTVLDCGFGDGYFLKFYKTNLPDVDIYGVDISQDAKDKIDFIAKNRLYVSDLSNIKLEKQFNIVHCFDVLYHILSDRDYRQTLVNMTELSDRYIILHEKFILKSQLISSKHVYMRQAEHTNQILNSKGFYLSHDIPTHFFAMRMLTYKLNKIIPKTLYKIDNHIVNNFHPSAQARLGTHHIRVYTKDKIL